MARDRATRLRELEQFEKQTSAPRRYRADRYSGDDRYRAGGSSRPLGINTMEAPEELLERRRYHRSRVAVTAGANNARNALLENVVILIGLIASIYGLYRLAIHLLNQV